MVLWRRGNSRTARRKPLEQQEFRCGYCRGWVRGDKARVETVRGQPQYVHAWHPVPPGRGLR